MSKTYRDRATAPRWSTHAREFRCRHCRLMVGPTLWGGRHRNHCPFCLHSRHVDAARPGDRASDCGGLMAAIGAFTRRDGEYMLVHECLTCGVVRHNRIAADDDYDLVLRLPLMSRRQRGATAWSSLAAD